MDKENQIYNIIIDWLIESNKDLYIDFTKNESNVGGYVNDLDYKDVLKLKQNGDLSKLSVSGDIDLEDLAMRIANYINA